MAYSTSAAGRLQIEPLGARCPGERPLHSLSDLRVRCRVQLMNRSKFGSVGKTKMVDGFDKTFPRFLHAILAFLCLMATCVRSAAARGHRSPDERFTHLPDLWNFLSVPRLLSGGDFRDQSGGGAFCPRFRFLTGRPATIALLRLQPARVASSVIPRR